MANPTWSLDNFSFTTLPGYYVIGGSSRSIKSEQLRKETDSGAIWLYQMWTRKIFDLKFILTTNQVLTHTTFYNLVVGKAFYYSPTGSGSSDSVYVRANPDFEPQERTKGKIPTDSNAILYDITYHLEEEFV